MSRLYLAAIATLALASCTPLTQGLASLGALDNPGVSVDAQVGRENTRTTNVTGVQVSPRPEPRPQNVTADTVQTTINNEAPLWVWLLLILGWLLPSPGEIGRGLAGMLRLRS